MSQPGPRQTKKQKKALAFRTRQKTGKKKNRKDVDDEDPLGFPIDENQDLGGLADLPPEAPEVSTYGGSDGRKGKAEGDGQRQVQSGGSKKRKREREGEEVVSEKPRKKSNVHVQPAVTESSVEGGDVGEATKVKKEVQQQQQRFILFIGTFSPVSFCVRNVPHICDDCRQSEVLYDKRCHSFSFLLMR